MLLFEDSNSLPLYIYYSTYATITEFCYWLVSCHTCTLRRYDGITTNQLLWQVDILFFFTAFWPEINWKDRRFDYKLNVLTLVKVESYIFLVKQTELNLSKIENDSTSYLSFSIVRENVWSKAKKRKVIFLDFQKKRKKRKSNNMYRRPKMLGLNTSDL